eukprot:scaffold2917_cov191-Amphora_coffeaeformis.AAC.53
MTRHGAGQFFVARKREIVACLEFRLFWRAGETILLSVTYDTTDVVLCGKGCLSGGGSLHLVTSDTGSRDEPI